MTTDTLKTITISLTSSFCTALFIVACSASADKAGEPPSLTSGYDDDGGGYGGGSDVGGGGDDVDDDDDGLSSSDLADVQADIVAIKCFIGHMTDNQHWVSRDEEASGYPGEWDEIQWNRTQNGATSWGQGPNSDAMKAYEDCF